MKSYTSWPASVPVVLVAAWFWLGLLPVWPSKYLDNGVDPDNLGKGDWIYVMSYATNKLGGYVPSVVNIPTLMSFYKKQGLQFIAVKSATSDQLYPSSGSPQFNSNLVYQAHAAGLQIFGYNRSHGTNIPGEINMAAYVYNLGADGFVIDAEIEWESSHLGTNGPSRALQLCQAIKAAYPNKFLAHAPFPIISYHSSFPYKEFGRYCDAVMPQDYWKSIGVTPAYMNTWRDTEWRNWQNSLTGIDTNAIKPLAPIAQGWSPDSSNIVTGAEITDYINTMKATANPVTPGGYKGVSFWRTDLHTLEMWTAISNAVVGDRTAPIILAQPANQSVFVGEPASFTVDINAGSLPVYQWYVNSNKITAATNFYFTISSPVLTNAGWYAVVVTNNFGAVTSRQALLTVKAMPVNLNVQVVAGGADALISWSSLLAGTGWVEYGLSTNFGLVSCPDATISTNHLVYLAGLSPDSLYHFRLSTLAGTNLFPSSLYTLNTAGEVIMDNAEAVYTGTWTTGTMSTDKYGANYQYASGETNITANAYYFPDLGLPGRYDVFVWYPDGSNRSSNVPVRVYYNGGNITTRVNQKSSGGLWNQVGTNLPFLRGTNGYVRIYNDTEETNNPAVMADAVRWVYRRDQDAPTNSSVPAWWAGFFFPTNANALLDHDGDGLPTWMEYRLGTNPTNAVSRLTVTPGLATNQAMQITLSPFYTNRIYRVQRKSSLAAAWSGAVPMPIVMGSNGTATLVITNGLAPSDFYRLQVDWAP